MRSARRAQLARTDLILCTPGPVRTPPLVAEYLLDPPCNYHRQQGFRDMFAETETDLKALLGIAEPAAYFATHLTSTGTGGNEACLLALEGLGPGLIVVNGFFAARIAAQAAQNGIAHEVLALLEDRPIDPTLVEEALERRPHIRWLFFVSHETRSGLLNPLVALGCVGRGRGLMVAADIVSSAYAHDVDIEAAGLDLAVTSSAKGLMSVPGLAIVFVRLATLATLERARASGGSRGYALDLVAECARQRRDSEPRFAQPVLLHAALRGACIHLRRTGIAAHLERIRRQMHEVHRHLEGLGVPAQLDPAYRSWVAVNFLLPEGLDYPRFARQMEAEGYYLLYGIPGDSTHFQVSTIGHLSDLHIDGLKAALTRTLSA